MGLLTYYNARLSFVGPNVFFFLFALFINYHHYIDKRKKIPNTTSGKKKLFIPCAPFANKYLYSNTYL
jgi:hypothetical protein